ncbi:hypothetical protein ACF09C_05565 [Streptomyces sp. NPDC014870]|uniref:hypothetical protein n=1 Tax=Streptomyces sp. NPDC014870 TaxID=3364925 RepID=UPI0036FEFCE2
MPGATGEPVTHRNWTDEWVTVRCVACGRADEWPHPELGCACGTVLRVPVRPVTGGPGPARGTGPGAGTGDGTGRGTGSGTGADSDTGPWRVVDPRTAADPRPGTGEWCGPGDGGDGGPRGERAGGGRRHTEPDPAPDPTENRAHAAPQSGGHRAFADRYPAHIPLPPTAPHPAPPRPSFRPVTIRTARDAVVASAGYLRWLGFRDVVQPEERSTSEVDLRAPGLVAQVDPSTRPAGLRAVECLWLNGLSSTAVSVFFSLAGYTPEARSRADELGIPLFVLDLTGTPQPVNTPADELVTTGA